LISVHGIKPDWYGIDDDRQHLRGTFSEHRGMHHKNHTADDRAGGAQAAGLNHFPAKIRRWGGVRRSNQNRPLEEILRGEVP